LPEIRMPHATPTNPPQAPSATKPVLYAHPFSSYCQKVLTALYEHGTPFEYRMLDSAERARELEALWPIKRFPLLVDAGRTLVEATIIIEHLDLHHAGPVHLIPPDPQAALEVRMMDRFFDNYVSTPQQRIVADRLRSEGVRDAHGVGEARAMLDTAYAWLDRTMATRTWAAGEAFSLADCAAAPFLFYADWTHPIDEAFANVKAYRRRLLARPSFARAVDEARPYRPLFPLGAPDRD
jgi:glutathione S-transferase